MTQIDYVNLIENCLYLAALHRKRLIRGGLSIQTPLSDGLVRFTNTPIYGRRAPSTPRPSIMVLRSPADRRYAPGYFNDLPSADVSTRFPDKLTNLAGTRYPARPIDITGAKRFNSELALLQEFQNLHQLLLSVQQIPSTKVPVLMSVLSKFPVLSISILSRESGVSKDTAKRWLGVLNEKGKLAVRNFNGMNQYAYKELVEILDNHLRYSATP